MTETPHIVENLMAEVSPPPHGILSLTIHDGDGLRLVLFGFATGEELSEHTAARPAVVHVLTGDADVTVGELRRSLGPGAWIHMPASTSHSIRATSPLTIALYLLGPTARSAGVDANGGASPA